MDWTSWRSSYVASGRYVNAPSRVASEGLSLSGGGTGVSFAHGLPLRVMITSSPCSSSLSIALAFALNSRTLYVVMCTTLK